MKKLVSLAVCLCLVLGLLAGCGGTQGAEIKGEVNLYTWEGMFPQEVLDAFTAETGYQVNYSSFDTDETMLARLEAAEGGDYDVVIADDYIIETAIAQGLVSELDKTKLSNIGNVTPFIRASSSTRRMPTPCPMAQACKPLYMTPLL